MPATGNQTINDIDFGRSFVRFSSTRVNHTPRLGLAACCTFAAPDAPPRTYHLSVACMAENMYVPKDLVQNPPAEFNIILLPKTEFKTYRRHADGARDVRSAQLIDQPMPTHDGKGAKVVELDVHLARFARATPIETYAQFREALLDNHPINARTTYTDDDGRTQITLDYPANTVNVRHEPQGWQLDPGPILFPANPAAAGKLLVDRLEIAAIIYNSFDYAEVTIRRLSPVGQGGQSMFYHENRPLRCRNQMFRCG